MKKMRILIYLSAAFLLLGSTSSFAQGRFGKDSADCVNYLNFYRDYYKQGNYKEATPLWIKAMHYCPPRASQYLFIDGRKIMTYRIKNHKGTPEQRHKLIDSLIMLSDVRAKYYPKNAHSAKENKVVDMLEFMDGDAKKIFDEVDAIIKEVGVNASTFILVTAMDKAKTLYQNKEMSDSEVLAVYSDISPIMDAKVKAHPSDDNKSAQVAFENLFITSGVANCDNLIAVFGPRFEENPNDKELVKTIVKLLSDNECIQSELFLKTVTTLNQLEPSYISAHLLYKLHSSRDENEEALKCLQEAIDSPDSDAARDGELLFEMATYYFKKVSNPVKAVQVAKEAAELNPQIAGKAYFLIGSIWSNQKCGGNEIEQRAKYWVAVDYLIKAKAADSSLTEEANKLISQFSQYFPKTEDAFMYDVMDGKSFSVSCSGLSATTTVRTIK